MGLPLRAGGNEGRREEEGKRGRDGKKWRGWITMETGQD